MVYAQWKNNDGAAIHTSHGVNHLEQVPPGTPAILSTLLQMTLATDCLVKQSLVGSLKQCPFASAVFNSSTRQAHLLITKNRSDNPLAAD